MSLGVSWAFPGEVLFDVFSVYLNKINLTLFYGSGEEV